MPSFDVVSEVDAHELANAIDQANRVLQSRYDFKNVEASFEVKEEFIHLYAEVDFQLQQMLEVLNQKLSSRGIDVSCLDIQKYQTSGLKVKQAVQVKQGIEQALSKKIIQLIKESKLKVQHQIQGEKIRVTAKKRDDLQQVMAMLRESSIEQPLQFNNFRD